MIAPFTLLATFFHDSFVTYFLRNKLTFLLLALCLFSSQLYSIFQATLLPLTLTFVILFLLRELGDEVHMEAFLLLLEWLRMKVFVVRHGLAESWVDSIQDEIDYIVVCYLSIDIKSINIFHVFLNTTCFFEITDLVKSPVWLRVVAIVLPNGVLDLFSGITPLPVSFLPF